MENGRSKNRNRASALVRGGEKFVKIVANIVGAVREVGGSEEDLDRLDKPGSPLLIAIARLIREPDAIVVGDPEELLIIAMYHTGTSLMYPDFQLEYFAGCLGDVGDGYEVVAPPRPTDDDRWYQDQIDRWLAEMARVGYEPATLADGFRYVSGNVMCDGDSLACVGSVDSEGRFPLLARREGGHLLLSHGGPVKDDVRFLLRKAKKPAVKDGSCPRNPAPTASAPGPGFTDLEYWRARLYEAVSLSRLARIGDTVSHDILKRRVGDIIAKLGSYSGLLYWAGNGGCVIARPPKPFRGAVWSREEINDWLRGPEVHGKGLSVAGLADGLQYLAEHIDGPNMGFVVWGGELEKDVVAGFQIVGETNRQLVRFHRERGIPCSHGFLLCGSKEAGK